MKVTAVATRAGSWWAVRVPEVEGAFTQARRLDEVPEMVADAVALLTGTEVDNADVDVVVEMDPEINAEIKAARAEATDAAEAQKSAAARQRQLARKLRAKGLTGRDASRVLEISPQRFSQLLK